MKIELHLTYRCNLACWNCNRGCRVRTDHTPDLTRATLERFLREAPEFETLVLIGGEPTLHPHLLEFVDLIIISRPAVKFALYSNAKTKASQRVLEQLKTLGIHNCGGTDKKTNWRHDSAPVFVSPSDLGTTRQPCGWAGTMGCGYSVDEYGITACAIGGAIDGILGLGLRTWDWSKVGPDQLAQLCRHCGAQWDQPSPEGLPQFRGQPMTKTWLQAAATKRARMPQDDLGGVQTPPEPPKGGAEPRGTAFRAF